MIQLDHIVRAFILARSLLVAEPRAVRTEKAALAHAFAAASTAGDLDPALMLAVARYETMYRPRSVSQVRGQLFCGVMQTRAFTSRRECRRQANLVVGYRLGAEELRYWLRVTRGDVRKALAGHCCGNAALKRCRGRCARYVRRIVARWEEIR